MTLPQDIAALAESIVNTLTQTDYQHVDKIDPASGVYDCDCNGFVAHLLRSAAPQNLAAIPIDTQPGSSESRSRAFEYYDFFASLTARSTGGWSRINLLSDAGRGDVMAWRFPTIEPGVDTGHVVLLAETPRPILPERSTWCASMIPRPRRISKTPACPTGNPHRRERRASVQASSISKSMASAIPSPICSRRPSPLNIPIVPSRSDARGRFERGDGGHGAARRVD
jgi:hypothetical protein